MMFAGPIMEQIMMILGMIVMGKRRRRSTFVQPAQHLQGHSYGEDMCRPGIALGKTGVEENSSFNNISSLGSDFLSTQITTY